MRTAHKWLIGLGIGAAVAVAALLVVRAWVIPAIIEGRLRGMFAGKVTYRSYWLNFGSSGVVGLTLREGPRDDSPVVAVADRVATDLSLGGLLRGRLAPRSIRFVNPKFTFRLDKEGRFVNLPTVRSSGGSASAPAPFPDLEATGAEVTFRPDGRPEMVVRGIAARLRGGRLSGGTDDPSWGHWEATGAIDPTFRSGSVALEGPHVSADPEALRRVPFIPAEVWSHALPRGPVGVKVALGWGKSPAIESRAEVNFLGTDAAFPSLGFDARRTTGRLVVVNGVVRAEGVRGEAIGGSVRADGSLDFARKAPRIDLGLDLAKVDVTRAPKSWQLDEAGITGRLTGKVQLKVVLGPDGVDLSGSSGEAVVEGGTIQGIPVKSLTLVMRAEKDDLQYDSKPAPGSSAGAWPLPALLVALQAPPEATKEKEKEKETIHLPKSITTRLELEDVSIPMLVTKVQGFLGYPLPLPINGQLSVKATATIPLGALRDFKDYAFHGDLTIKGASIDGVDVGRVSSRIDLADGVLELKDFRGRLVDRPDGGPDNPPAPTAPSVPDSGPLPSGGFRGNLRAEVSPPGRLVARFEGSDLPLGELAAPALPRPTPLSGLASMSIRAEVDLGDAARPEAWDVSGDARSVRIAYLGAVLDEFAIKFALKGGTLDVPTLSAKLAGQPLRARGHLDLKPPRAFAATIDVNGWDLAALLALIPGAPRPSPVSGTIDARAEASGTLAPWSIRTEGQGRFGRLTAGPVTLGDVPLHWATEGDAIVIKGVEAHPFGGRLTAEARVPVVSGKPAEGTATIVGLDTAALSAALPGEGIKLTGRADGRVRFTVPPDHSAVEATVGLSAPDLTVQGIPAEQVRASVRARGKAIAYEVTADSLGGKVKFQGEIPLTWGDPTTPGEPGNGEIKLAGFQVARATEALGLTGASARIGGLGAIDANIRSIPAGPDAGLWVHGIAEFRDLTWGRDYPLGRLRGIVAKSPTAWRVEPIDGELLGGVASGLAWGATAPRAPRRAGFSFRVEQADLRRVLAALPLPPRSVEGSANLRVAGDLAETLRATAEIEVAEARLLGLPLRGLRVPAELALAPGSGSGQVRLRRASTRFAGGRVEADGTFRLGEDRSFQADAKLTDVDIETFARVYSEARRPASGRVSGRIGLGGPDPALPSRYRGRVVLDLDDASLVALPVLSALDRFLGSAGGGLFEDGDLVGTIANRQLVIEMFTLEGRIAQVHITGTVGFDGQLNLEVLVNTNQIIPQTGQALVAAIPGLRGVLDRREQASLQVANYLSNRLLKLRVGGTIKNPSIGPDRTVPVAGTAVSFFAGVLKLPLGLVK